MKYFFSLSLLCNVLFIFSQEVIDQNVYMGSVMTSHEGSFYSLTGNSYFQKTVFGNEANVDIMYWYENIGMSAPYEVVDTWEILNKTTFDIVDSETIIFDSLTAFQIDSIVENMDHFSSISDIEEGMIIAVQPAETSASYPYVGVLKLTAIESNHTIEFHIKKINRDEVQKQPVVASGTAELNEEVSVFSHAGNVSINIGAGDPCQYMITDMYGSIAGRGDVCGTETLTLSSGFYVVTLESSSSGELRNFQIAVSN